MANELKFGNKVIFLNGIPVSLPVATSDPGSAVNGDLYYNSTANQVKVYQAGAWTFLSTGSSVAAGTAGELALYPASGTALSPTFTQNAQSINVSIAAQPTRSVGLVYTFPNPGDAIAAASIVLTEGTQVINGNKTLSGTINLSSLTASLPLQLDASKNIVSTAINLASSQVSGILPLANGGTNANLTASNGAVVYSSASALALTAVGSTGQILQSAGATTPTWSTATYPSTTVANNLLYSSATNTVSNLATANTSALVTSNSGVPSWASGTTANRVLRTDGTTVSFSQVALTTDVSGTLPIGSGGTNSATALNNNRVMISSGGAIVENAAITANRALASNASGLPVASATTDTELGFLSGVTSAIQTQINGKVSKSGDSMTGNLTFSSTFGIDNTAASGTLNIGATNATTINIGHAGSTVNVLGTLTYVQTSTLEVSNPNIILNEAGAAGSGNGAGIQINEGGVAPASIITASVLVGNTRSSWELIAPAKAGTFRLTASSNAQIGEIAQAALTAGRTWTMPDATGTVALITGATVTAANTLLSNLGTTSINSDLLPSADLTRNLGSSSLRWSNLFASAISGVGNALTLQTTAGNANVVINANGTGTLDIEATKVRRTVNGADSTNFMEDQYFDALTLTANISSPTEISSSLSFALASFDSAIIEYKIKEATSNKARIGQFIVTTDGTVASSSDQFSESAVVGSATGLVLTADISGGNVRILYNSTNASNAATMRCNIRRFRT